MGGGSRINVIMKMGTDKIIIGTKIMKTVKAEKIIVLPRGIRIIGIKIVEITTVIIEETNIIEMIAKNITNLIIIDVMIIKTNVEMMGAMKDVMTAKMIIEMTDAMTIRVNGGKMIKVIGEMDIKMIGEM